MRQTWFLCFAAVLIAAPVLYADDADPPRHREGDEGPRHHPEGGEGRRPVFPRVFRGVLIELGEKGLALKIGDAVVDIRYPPRVPDPLEKFLKQHKGKPVALRCVRRERFWVLLGPVEREAGPRPREHGEAPPRGPREGDAPPPRGPRDGEGPPRHGPRDGEGPPPRGPRDAEGPPRREGEGPRPPRHPERPHPMREHERAMRDHMRKVELAERKARELAEQVRRTDDTEKRDALVGQLKKLLAGLFEMREAPKRKQLDLLQAEVERLRKILKLRAENKEKIVARRLRDLVGPQDEDDLLHW